MRRKTVGPRKTETLRFTTLVSLGDEIRAAAARERITPQQWMLNACREKLVSRAANGEQAA